MSSLIRRIQRTVRIVRQRDKETGEMVSIPRSVRSHYMGRGSKLGIPVASPWPPHKKRAKPHKTLAERKAAREKSKAIRAARVAAVPPPKERTRGFSRHYRGRPGMPPPPLANLSANHPDYGCSPAEHARRKEGRNG